MVRHRYKNIDQLHDSLIFHKNSWLQGNKLSLYMFKMQHCNIIWKCCKTKAYSPAFSCFISKINKTNHQVIRFWVKQTLDPGCLTCVSSEKGIGGAKKKLKKLVQFAHTTRNATAASLCFLLVYLNREEHLSLAREKITYRVWGTYQNRAWKP